MRRMVLALALLGLAACRTEEAAPPDPVSLTEEVVGYYCQMDLFEHPGPKAQVHLDGVPRPIFFSQVRDAVAYQRMPEQSSLIAVAYVNDMGAPGATWEEPGAENWIPADAAFYVIGSDAVGGMGAPELVPFADEAGAVAFAAANGGRVMRLDDIQNGDVLSPVALEGEPSSAPGDGDAADYRGRLEALATEVEG
jgi:copper chaperone NosL